MRDTESHSKSEVDIRIGIDLVQIDRFQGLAKDSNFVKRVFTPPEIEYCYSFSDPAPHLAATFAGKEAVFKTIEEHLAHAFNLIEILRDDSGAPYVFLRCLEHLEFRVSLTHTQTHAAAVALCFSPDLGIHENTLEELLNTAVSQLMTQGDAVDRG